MGSFIEVNSGIPGLDHMLHHIRMGDNVVWQVSSLDDYRTFAKPFARQMISEGRNVIYIRFSGQPSVLTDFFGVQTYCLNASSGFESFTINVHNIITKEGSGAIYIFDSLSDLQAAWFTDLMMGNFFCVTCPYLFEMDTVAFFPLLRGHHSFETIARIRETTQLFLDVYSDENVRYLHPLKVWNRYSPEMFLPHRMERDQRFSVLANGIDMSAFYSLLHLESTFIEQQNLDSYERFFQSAKDSYLAQKPFAHTAKKIVLSMMTRDPRLSCLILDNFEPRDYLFIKDRMIGTGTIGGKACGMLLARKLLELHLPQYKKRLEPHDSFFIGTDVFYSYIVENGFWNLRIEQKNDETYFPAGEVMKEKILAGTFSSGIREQFRRMLEYFGQSPVIVRSSSFLEDGFGSAFAGKYESIFCANGGSPEGNLKMLENAVKRVYASTMDHSALEYRKTRGLAKNDEQMAILVQRVSGTRFGDYFMPCAAGTGFSYSLYRWNSDLDPHAGMLRLVAGMGTRAVDRTDGDYPRLVNLDRPERSPLSDPQSRHKFSQRNMDAIVFSRNRIESIDACQLLPQFPRWYRQLIAEHDREAERNFYDRGELRDIQYISCEKIVHRKEFTTMMQNILKTLETQYGVPVDIEYTVNFNEENDFMVNLVQCRPLSVWKKAKSIRIPELSGAQTFFKIRKTFMGDTASQRIDYVIWIDSENYYRFPYVQKGQLVSAVDKINRHFSDKTLRLMLVVPGRIGTSSPELGIPVGFSNISNFNIICEYSDGKTGYMPELSYGSHMFQDLVEAKIFYAAILETEDTLIFNKNFWAHSKNIFSDICPEYGSLNEVIGVYRSNSLMLYADIKEQEAVCVLNIQ
ncbi:phosphoenolpyruvate synthase [Blautia liquoris]|uniref:Phosphoenolpyruvate synthase n=1 Tax=Blautia liquoris TaxID=2779518 RepID=A0A7M2RJZ4_9FIRM|nr:PEP/pyruvate-binding domain-containing protein [Blautia liquoris]QOV19887.1 phosphoenolpyruvate synthase [Blautia liquoris]